MTLVLAAVFLWGLASRNLLLAVPLGSVIWVAWVLINPFTKCGWCRGTGRHPMSGRH